jgi:uncharacterized protein (TIGR03067 family)
MTAFMLAIAMTAAEPPAAPAIDGNWTVVSYEKNGQPMAEAKDCTVTVKDNTFTFSPKDGSTKMKAMRAEFGPMATLKITETDAISTNAPADKSAGEAKQGVYVLSQDYLAICLHDTAGRPTPGENRETTGRDQKTASNKSYCTVILKRATR